MLASLFNAFQLTNTHNATLYCLHQNPCHITCDAAYYPLNLLVRRKHAKPCSFYSIGHACLWMVKYTTSVRSADCGFFSCRYLWCSQHINYNWIHFFSWPCKTHFLPEQLRVCFFPPFSIFFSVSISFCSLCYFLHFAYNNCRVSPWLNLPWKWDFIGNTLNKWNLNDLKPEEWLLF